MGVDVPAPELASGHAASGLDGALRQLDVLARALQRQLSSLDELLASGPPLPAPEPQQADVLLARQQAADAELDAARTRLTAARERAAARAEQRQAERDRDAQLADLARLALMHLGDRCPVCTQGYDHQVTVDHLNALIARGEPSSGTEALDDVDELPALVAAVSRAEAALADAQSALSAHDAAAARAGAAHEERRRRLADAGLDPTADAESVRQARQSAASRLEGIERLRPDGERLALGLARRAEGARRDELDREARRLAERTKTMQAEIEERNLTGELAQQLLEAVRSAAADVVGLQLRYLEPLLARIYARIDPHPALREVGVRSWTERGRGRLRTQLSDPTAGFATDLPATVLSSSQLNAFAVATFLALNMGVPRVPLQTAILDDPLQTLDDVNLLGVVDLLRRVKERRQLIITTHDTRFGSLLERKLRALDGSALCASISRDGRAEVPWSPSGMCLQSSTRCGSSLRDIR